MTDRAGLRTDRPSCSSSGRRRRQPASDRSGRGLGTGPAAESRRGSVGNEAVARHRVGLWLAGGRRSGLVGLRLGGLDPKAGRAAVPGAADRRSRRSAIRPSCATVAAQRGEWAGEPRGLSVVIRQARSTRRRSRRRRRPRLPRRPARRPGRRRGAGGPARVAGPAPRRPEPRGRRTPAEPRSRRRGLAGAPTRCSSPTSLPAFRDQVAKYGNDRMALPLRRLGPGAGLPTARPSSATANRDGGQGSGRSRSSRRRPGSSSTPWPGSSRAATGTATARSRSRDRPGARARPRGGRRRDLPRPRGRAWASTATSTRSCSTPTRWSPGSTRRRSSRRWRAWSALKASGPPGSGGVRCRGRAAGVPRGEGRAPDRPGRAGRALERRQGQVDRRRPVARLGAGLRPRPQEVGGPPRRPTGRATCPSAAAGSSASAASAAGTQRDAAIDFARYLISPETVEPGPVPTAPSRCSRSGRRSSARACPTRGRRPGVDPRQWSDAVSQTLHRPRGSSPACASRRPTATSPTSPGRRALAAVERPSPPRRPSRRSPTPGPRGPRRSGAQRQLWHYRRSLNSPGHDAPSPPTVESEPRDGRDRRRADTPAVSDERRRDRDQGAARPVRRPGVRPPGPGPRVRARAGCTRGCRRERDGDARHGPPPAPPVGRRSPPAPTTGRDVFAAPIAALWRPRGAEPPAWAVAARPAPPPPRRRPRPRRQRRPVQPPLAPRSSTRSTSTRSTGMIDQYNRYYVLEKECVLGSARLAARHFAPKAARDPRRAPGAIIRRLPRSRARRPEAGVASAVAVRMLEPAACLDPQRRLSSGALAVALPRSSFRSVAAVAVRRPPPSRDRRSTVRGDVPARGPSAARSRRGSTSCSARRRRAVGAAVRARTGSSPQPFFAVEAKDWKPGEPLQVGADAAGFPGPARHARAGRVRGPGGRPAQPRHAPARRRRGERLRAGRAPRARPRGKAATDRARGRPRRPAPAVSRRPTGQARRARQPAPLGLPRPADHAPRGGHPARGRSRPPAADALHHPRVRRRSLAWRADWSTSRRFAFGKDLIRVVLDPDCGTGHHVFADSATNGPRGRALVEELIPHIEKTFPRDRRARARLLNGHSSGGWSSLWLQVTYPDTFGGIWSTSPDPVDFRDFQRIDLYAPGENMFRDRDGKRRPIARMGRQAGPLLRRLLADGRRDRRRRPAPLVRGRLQPARARRPPAPALGPRHRRDRPRGRQGLGGVRHPARPRAELADARPEARRQAPRHHRRRSTRSTSKVPSRLLKESLAAARAATRSSRSSPARTTARSSTPSSPRVSTAR